MRALKRILAGMCMAAVMMTIFTPSELKASELKAPRGIEITAEETTVPVRERLRFGSLPYITVMSRLRIMW